MRINLHTHKQGLSNSGFTLAEVLVTFFLLAFCLCGLLLTYIDMLNLTELSRSLTLGTNAVQKELEDIKRTNFDCLCTSGTTCGGCGNCFYNGQVFDIAGFSSLDAKGRIEICDNTIGSCPTIISYSDLKRVRLVACFKSRGRVFGEDQNLDGSLNTGAGEDNNGNNRLDCPVEVITLISR